MGETESEGEGKKGKERDRENKTREQKAERQREREREREGEGNSEDRRARRREHLAAPLAASIQQRIVTAQRPLADPADDLYGPLCRPRPSLFLLSHVTRHFPNGSFHSASRPPEEETRDRAIALGRDVPIVGAIRDDAGHVDGSTARTSSILTG